ncbi:putative oligopeptide transport ATP-binding protein YkfD [Clostridia bacterium]|nr:putative oligopeptide transport ATP-binding protein YkfD [Clostridia bacterium]
MSDTIEPLIRIENLVKTFAAPGRRRVHAVNGISFDIRVGETFSLVGESGCGKSTTGRLIDHLIAPDSGSIYFQSRDITQLSDKQMRPLRAEMQMIFQDPNMSLNPRMRVEDAVAEPLRVHTDMNASARLKAARELLGIVGLSEKHAQRWPHEFSGGQRQRIGIARALTVHPKLIIADEPVSSLDVSIQAQVLGLMQRLQKEFALTYLFISHDLSVVEMISDRIGVMYLGYLVEVATSRSLYAHPTHPYTQALLSAVPIPDPDAERSRVFLEGELPSAVNLPTGCPFVTRCPKKTDICAEKLPEMRNIAPGHSAACHHAG